MDGELPGAEGEIAGTVGEIMNGSEIDKSENILSDSGLAVYRHGNPVFPCLCELCWHVIVDGDDDLEWHGYGNCADIPDYLWDEM